MRRRNKDSLINKVHSSMSLVIMNMKMMIIQMKKKDTKKRIKFRLTTIKVLQIYKKKMRIMRRRRRKRKRKRRQYRKILILNNQAIPFLKFQIKSLIKVKIKQLFTRRDTRLKLIVYIKLREIIKYCQNYFNYLFLPDFIDLDKLISPIMLDSVLVFTNLPDFLFRFFAKSILTL